MNVELTWLQYQVAEVLKNKELTAWEISTFIADKNQIQIKNSLRYLLDKGLVEHNFKNDTYKLLFQNYMMRKDVQNFLDRTSDEHLIPCIKVYQPTEKVIMDVRIMSLNGYSRSEIAKELNIKKSAVLWTMINHLSSIQNDSFDELIELNDVQFEVYKAIGKKYKNKIELEKRLNMSYESILQIIFELNDLNCVYVKKIKDDFIFERLDVAIKKKERIKNNGD